MCVQARTLAMLSTPPYQWLFYDPADDLHDLLLQFPDIAVNFTVLSLTSFNSPPPDSDLKKLEHALLSDAITLVTSSYSKLTSTSTSHTPKTFREELNRVMRQVR